MNVGQERQPKARIFLTGANEWRYLNGWPAPKARRRTLYFGATGSAVGIKSKGTLSETRPGKSKPSTFTYDPRKVEVPEVLKKGTADPDAATTRIAIDATDKSGLLYKSAPMTAPLDFAGPVEVDIYFSTTAKDTDFFVNLVDIDPKGIMRVICMPGKMRAKYLSGWETPSLLTPGKTYRMVLRPWDTAHRFKKGHRLGVIITSEAFPLYARNLNTGESYATGTRIVVAKQTIYHDSIRPSAIRFYVLPPK